VYGLNFPSKEDAQIFGQAVITALENLKSGGSGTSVESQHDSIFYNVYLNFKLLLILFNANCTKL